MPDDTPAINMKECYLAGAKTFLVNGLITDCGRIVGAGKKTKGWFDVSTLKEPYRIEGKKTMGLELAEQFEWELPDVILYPTGGGTGLIGIWKAFKEMIDMGWIDGPLPRMVAVQSLNCAPVVRAFYDPAGWMDDFQPQPSLANGLAVPYPFGMDMMQEVLHESGGMAYAVSEEEIVDGVKEIARTEGMLVAPEGAAAGRAQPRHVLDQARLDPLLVRDELAAQPEGIVLASHALFLGVGVRGGGGCENDHGQNERKRDQFLHPRHSQLVDQKPGCGSHVSPPVRTEKT